MIGGTEVRLGLPGELLAEFGVAVVGPDLGGVICSWNEAAARLYGREACEMLGTAIQPVAFLPTTMSLAARSSVR